MAIRKIFQGPAAGANAKPEIVEGVSSAEVRAGALVMRTATGLDESDKASTVMGQEPLVAREVPLSLGGDINVKWPADNTVEAIAFRSGELGAVLVAAGNNITAMATPLTSAGDGTCKIASTDGSDIILFHAEQVINVTGEAQLVLVRRA